MLKAYGADCNIAPTTRRTESSCDLARYQGPGRATARTAPRSDDVTQDDVTQDDVTQDDVTQDDVTQDDVTQDDVTQDDVTQDDVTQDDVTQDDVTQDDVTRTMAGLLSNSSNLQRQPEPKTCDLTRCPGGWAVASWCGWNVRRIGAYEVLILVGRVRCAVRPNSSCEKRD